MSQVWLSERLMAVASVLMVGWSVLVACSGTATRPNEGCYAGAASVTCNVVRVAVTTDGPFTVFLNGRTIQGNSSRTDDVSDAVLGTHDIIGTMSGTNLTIVLTSVATSTAGVVQPGVVQRGSLATLAGPGATVAACSVGYSIPSGGARPQAFRARYTLYAGTDKC